MHFASVNSLGSMSNFRSYRCRKQCAISANIDNIVHGPTTKGNCDDTADEATAVFTRLMGGAAIDPPYEDNKRTIQKPLPQRPPSAHGGERDAGCVCVKTS